MSNLLDDKATCMLITDISKNDENFLRDFSRDFYQKIIDINDFNVFESTLSEWIKDTNKDSKTILQLMQKNEFWFSSIIGFFCQYGIDCDVDMDKSLKLYLLAANNEVPSNQKFTNLHLLEENGDLMRNINIIIGKILLSLFYYKDIILENKLNDFIIKYLKSSRKGDPVAQYNLGYCYQHGQGVTQDYKKAFEWYYKSANNGCGEGQNSLGECYYYGQGVAQDYKKAIEWYSKSANNGCYESQNSLGDCYYYGQGDYKKAFEWYY